MTDYWGIDSRIYENYRFQKMSERQQSILLFTLTGDKARLSNGFGIYPISTSCFKHISREKIEQELGKRIELLPNIDIESVREELGSTPYELYLTKKPQTNENRIGKMVRDFPDFIDYDPDKDVIFSKKFFEYTGRFYLTTPKVRIEALNKSFNSCKHFGLEEWWGELMNLYDFKADWQEYFINHVKEDKKITPIQKNFEKLFQLQEKYNSKNIFSLKNHKNL